MSRFVRAVQFDPDGSVVVEFVDSDDSRPNGMQMHKALFLPESLVEADALLETISITLDHAIELFSDYTVEIPPDEEAGPYDNPEER